MSIPLFRPYLNPEAATRVAWVLSPREDGSIYLGQGERCEEFEESFGALVEAPVAPLFVNSCSSAIALALHLCGVGPLTEVITTPITCTATNDAIVTRGGRIAWADVDPLTGNIDPASVAALVTPRTKAVIAVDWGGRACDYDALRKAAPGIPIIEDAAHAFLSTRHGRSIAHSAGYAFVGEVPQGGDYVCWSTGAIKHLTTGMGGFLLPPSDQLERARLLRWHGLDRRSKQDFRCEQDIHEAGYQFQGNDVSAAIGLANLEGAAWSVAQSRENAAYYHTWLSTLPGIHVPPFDPGSAYWLFTMVVEDRADFMAHLAEHGIATSQVHRRNDAHPAFRAVAVNEAGAGVDAFDATQVSIPCGYWVTAVQRDYIAATVHAWAMERSRRAA
jgi:dTDP-4-amino-4,6-dideoxygalactose transaminase